MHSIIDGLALVLFRLPYRWKWPIMMVVLVGGSFAALAIQDVKIGNFERGSDDILGLSLGLDLAGGVHLVYQAGGEGFEPTPQQMEGLIATIIRRGDRLGGAEPSVQQFGDDRLVIQLPGIEDVEQAKTTIGQTAQLEIIERVCSATPCGEENPGSFNDQSTGLTGAHMSSAYSSQDPLTNEPVLVFELNRGSARLFAEVTQRIFNTNLSESPDQLAFVLDGEVLVSAGVISPILAGHGQIRGNFTPEEARTLAIQVEAGSLPIEITELSSTLVAASLGAQSLDQAIEAGLVGLGLVLLFMIAYYRMAGVVAAVSLIFYTAMVLAIFKLFPVTLTLAGMAGFILSLGMAVDANILIFERVKEEIRIGRNLQFAVQIGFNRAWTSIRDGNISTLLIAGVLFFFSGAANTAPRGFAIALAIGVGVSMFSAIVISRRILAIVVATKMRRYPSAFSPTGTAVARGE